MSKNRGILLILLVGILAVGLVSSARAAEFRTEDTIIIPAGEVIDDDLFLAGNRIEVNGTVRGDLVAAGAEVSVNGLVEGSLAISGQTLNVNGQVDGSVYAGGYALTVGREASIGRNVYFGGFSLTAEDGSSVGRSVYIGGYQGILDGTVEDEVVIGGAALEVNGRVGGDVRGEVGVPDQGNPPMFVPNFPGSVPMISPGVRVDAEADVGGQVDVEETRIQTEDDGFRGARVLLNLGSSLAERAGEFISLLIVGGLLIRFWPGAVQNAGSEAEKRPLPSAGFGCAILVVFAIGLPIVAGAILALAALGGLVTFGQLFNDILGLGMATLGTLVTAFLFVVSIVTKAVVAYLAGRVILNRISTTLDPGRWADFLALALGVLLYEILRVIPLLGWLTSVAVTLVGLGAIFYALRSSFGAPGAETPALESTA